MLQKQTAKIASVLLFYGFAAWAFAPLETPSQITPPPTKTAAQSTTQQTAPAPPRNTPQKQPEPAPQPPQPTPSPPTSQQTKTRDETIEIHTPQGVKHYPNYKYRALYTPNDYGNQWRGDRISLPAAWDKTVGSTSTTVAVIDTGFALNHYELDRWALNEGEAGDKKNNGIDDDANGYVDDWRGWDFHNFDNNPIAGTSDPFHFFVNHGTEVAGVLAATGNNNIGTAGVNWKTRLLPLQVLDDDGIGYTDSIVAAIDYAISRNVDVINLSLGGEADDALLEAAVDRALQQNILVVAASGNDGCNCMLYPAQYPQTLSVGATDSGDTAASFSSYGTNLDLVAPGANLTKAPTWLASNQRSAFATNLSGTSFATPIVSSAAALLKGIDGSLTVNSLTGLLKNNADKVSAMYQPDKAIRYGAGRLNVRAALDAADSSLPDQAATPLTPLFRLYKSGRPDEYTTSKDRKSTLQFKHSYNYEIIRFVQTN